MKKSIKTYTIDKQGNYWTRITGQGTGHKLPPFNPFIIRIDKLNRYQS